MSDIFHKALTEDAARINVSHKTWKQVKQSRGRKRKKANWKRRLLAYGAYAAILLIMAIGISGFVSPVMAKVLQKVPIIGELYSFTNIPKLNQYASEANPSVTDKGITVSVPKAYYDGNQVILIYAIQVPEGYEPIDVSQINLTVAKILLNGKPLPIDGATGKDYLVLPNTYRGDIVWYLSSDQVSRSGMLTIPIYQVGTIKGNWTLSVSVSSEAIDNAIETFHPKDASKTHDGITITVNKVNKGPVYTTISMQVRQPLQMNNRLPIYMPLNGMEFTVYTSSHKPPIYEGFTAINPPKEVGNEVVWDDLILRCLTPPDDVKSIIVEPVLAVMYEEGVTEGSCPNIPQLAITVPIN
ncbi:DUF4179 domain-containing protein [Desulfoscipio gibsoniae]|uniref:DUF4179 domain-containing protein n=1 Tax=Desulfoscipio gibsoniae DSM 7213 TaxID=767817 RepID=R4KH25_9FIRM|nr:DUF4179 domain-containing protein [Desulfoscipio gibsoniae]AGL02493.1 hypothetical protein Desgi_3134 [Desulfoscipio gibsoniae DSM 7213]